MNNNQTGRFIARYRFFATASVITLASLLHPVAYAQTQEPPEADQGRDVVVVTASRRAEDVTELPFNVSAYGSEQLEKSNVSNIAELSRQVPNFVLPDSGARGSAGAIPIIRGLNASVPTSPTPRLFDSPVGFYINNTPLEGYLPFIDVARVEVLRGPQGTLYGGGSLSGAVKVVAAEPEFSGVDGYVTASAGHLSHSDDLSYDVSGAVNLPVSDNAAFRFAAKYDYDAGFIDQKDIMRRVGDNYATGEPVLANPADIANSPALYFDEDDMNYTKTTSARASFRWEPTDALSLNLAYNYAYLEGVGGNSDNNFYTGGPSPIDARITLGPTGDYERSSPQLEPYNRRTDIAALDASYDLGFATLSSTLSYAKTRGESVGDFTQGILGSSFAHYYSGTPRNPRTILPIWAPSSEESYVQEIRLVSAETDSPIDYIVGAFFKQQERNLGFNLYAPGAAAQSAAAHGGSTVPIVLGGTYLNTDPVDQSTFKQVMAQKFEDYSAYADVTWNVSDVWSLTGGLRVFHQTFRHDQRSTSPLFFFDVIANNATEIDDSIYKLNTSYKWSADGQVYATLSQGYRRGGANGFVTTGFQAEPLDLLAYVPDKTTNYEVGAKGYFGDLRYSANVFFVDWEKPQINLGTPFNAWDVVVNGEKAESKGVELELAGDVGDTGLSYVLGLAYAKARLTEGFSLPAGDGAGNIIQNAIVGNEGDRLPGAPDASGSFTLNYDYDVGDGSKITFSLGADYRGSALSSLPSFTANSIVRETPAYVLLRGSAEYDFGTWRLSLYGTNLADDRTVVSRSPRSLGAVSRLGSYTGAEVVARPREIGLRITVPFQ